ncbi:hypothetical protein PVAP13_9NG844478 [Panicum virgatum]|uniref:Uncharacterized protein n=1 Tax=Panicum virgatum TaxID=38727 RepID=A0A8T0N1R8_PANVG|nr:hypothetical protein PVAP13_9NG844478 [Panicum virgatum]
MEANIGRQHADGVREAARRAHAPRQAARRGRQAAGAGEVTRSGRGCGSAADGQIRPGKVDGRMEGRRMSGTRSSAGTPHRSVSSRALLETAKWSTGSLLSPSHPPTGLQSRLLAWQNMPVRSPGETTMQPSARATKGSSAKLSSNRRALEMP